MRKILIPLFLSLLLLSACGKTVTDNDTDSTTTDDANVTTTDEVEMPTDEDMADMMGEAMDTALKGMKPVVDAWLEKQPLVREQYGEELTDEDYVTILEKYENELKAEMEAMSQ